MTMELLHRFDSLSGDAVIAATSPARLRGASFLDGRESISTNERIIRFAPADLSAGASARFVFHVGFCGSTLLSRLLDQPGQVLALREPQCLTDIASQRRAIRARQAIGSFAAIIGHALANLTSGAETVVIKPSNWINGALPDLVACGAVSRAVFLTCDRRAYLVAAFRGGRDRLAFCARLASELADEFSHGPAILAREVARECDPLDRMARIVALLHAMQEALFSHAIASAAIPGAALLDFAELVRNPVAICAQAQAALDLPTAPAPLSDALLRTHAKDPARGFSGDVASHADREVEAHHAARFDRALAWAEALDLGRLPGFSAAASP